MKHYSRGSGIVIETIFYDTSGDIAFPTSVTLAIAHPSTSSSWPLDGNELLTTTASMTTPSTTATSALYGIWQSTWSSTASGTGTVFWKATPSTLTYGVKEGSFVLTGNLASTI